MKARTGRPMVDHRGERFGKLTAVEFSHRDGIRYFWRFRCDCGNEKTIGIADVIHHGTRSCGKCPKPPTPPKPAKVYQFHVEHHGMCNTPTYQTWKHMKDRCYNTNATQFHRYGGRGITVCDTWRNSFTAFLTDMGPRPPDRTLDRINNNGNYEPGNCRWATEAEQNANRRDRTAVP